MNDEIISTIYVPLYSGLKNSSILNILRLNIKLGKYVANANWVYNQQQSQVSFVLNICLLCTSISRKKMTSLENK